MDERGDNQQNLRCLCHDSRRVTPNPTEAVDHEIQNKRGRRITYQQPVRQAGVIAEIRDRKRQQRQ